jgi:hypothetical protein
MRQLKILMFIRMKIYTPEKGATLVDLEEEELPLQLKENTFEHKLDVNR